MIDTTEKGSYSPWPFVFNAEMFHLFSSGTNFTMYSVLKFCITMQIIKHYETQDETLLSPVDIFFILYLSTENKFCWK